MKAIESGQKCLDVVDAVQPDLILLDVMLPDINGYEVCRILSLTPVDKRFPVIFLTSKTGSDELVKGFDVGAVDFISKPFNKAELLARIRTYIELKNARQEIQTLQGIIPICASCKQIRNDKGYWQQVERYIEDHSGVHFTHGICEECLEKMYKGEKWFDDFNGFKK